MATHTILQFALGGFILLAGLYLLLGTRVSLPGTHSMGSGEPIPNRRATAGAFGFVFLGLSFVLGAVERNSGYAFWGWLSIASALIAVVFFISVIVDRHRASVV